MHEKIIPRLLEKEVNASLGAFPVVAVLGPRQCGKSTLAKVLLPSDSKHLYLDLERPSDLNKLSEPEIFFDANKEKVICLDEIQRRPELFPVLRSVVGQRRVKGQFLILGSVSRFGALRGKGL